MAADTYTFTIGANSTDSPASCDPATATYVITILCSTLTSPSLPTALTSTEYRHQMTAALGLLPYRFEVVGANTLPGNMSLTIGGLLTGTPTRTRTALSTFDVKITDYNGCTTTVTRSLVVNCGSYTLPTVLPDGDTSSPYEIAFVTNGTFAFRNQ